MLFSLLERRDIVTGGVVGIQQTLQHKLPNFLLQHQQEDSIRLSDLIDVSDGIDDHQSFIINKLINEEGTSLETLQSTSYERIINAVSGGGCSSDAFCDCEVVLIGDATHGTDEFYSIRNEITKSLIGQLDDFDAILIEGDYPDVYNLNRYVMSTSSSSSSLEDAFDGFQKRFPTWMWRNNPTAEFVQWLKLHNINNENSSNMKLPSADVQMFGLDIYNPFRSMNEVVYFLDTIVKEKSLANKVRDQYYSTFQSFYPEPKDYYYALSFDRVKSQVDNVNKVVDILCSLEKDRLMLTSSRHAHHDDGDNDGEGRRKNTLVLKNEFFNAIQNAKVVVASESYFRQLYMGSDYIWNIRDTFFLQMIQDTKKFIVSQKQQFISSNNNNNKARIIIWAHNSHVVAGDNTKEQQKVITTSSTIGQLCKQTFGTNKVYIIGLTTHTGTVRAALRWGDNDNIMKLNPSFEGSHEYLLHLISKERKQNSFCYIFRRIDNNNTNNKSSSSTSRSDYGVDSTATMVFGIDRLERFVGVSYNSGENELRSNYSTRRPSDDYDCLIHVDHSNALRTDAFIK